MPPPRDLTGERFGKLVAVELAANKGRNRQWRCACDCGRDTLVVVQRLSCKDDSHAAIRACEACRSRSCIICGDPFLKPGSTATCGKPECRLANRRKVNLEAQRRAEVRAPGTRTRHQQERRAARSQEQIARDRERFRLTAQERRERLATEPDADARREAMRRHRKIYYHKNKDRINKNLKLWISKMPSERREAYREKHREYKSKYDTKKRLSQFILESFKIKPGNDK